MKLGTFGVTDAQQQSTTAAQTTPANIEQDEITKPEATSSDGDRTIAPSKPKTTRRAKPPQSDKLVTVNIKIQKSQQQWLSDTAQQVRDNNDEPVPPAERVYPQHLIGVAIALLQSADVDWEKVKNADELKAVLGIKH
ncbi:hypothetical protein ACQ4M4_25770 [Leptolyngbya sp. AN02str]